MTFEKLKPLAFELMGNRKAHLQREKGGIYYHGERVAKTVIILRKILLPSDESKDEILKIAALFHDIGKGIEPHDKYGATLAEKALKDILPSPMLDEIRDLISLHCDRRPQNNTYSETVKLLQDADILDHFGAYSVWVDFLYSAHTERNIIKTANYNVSRWEKCYTNNRDLLNYDISKKILNEKATYISKFYSRLQVECVGDIVNLDKLT